MKNGKAIASPIALLPMPLPHQLQVLVSHPKVIKKERRKIFILSITMTTNCILFVKKTMDSLHIVCRDSS